MSSPDLELIHLVKQYGATTAVDRIDLRIEGGRYCCLLGPSGCGKTTTLRMVAGHEAVSDGDILLGARNITDLPAAERGTAMMFQSYALFPHLSALDNVAFSLKMRGIDRATRHARAMELLERVSLAALAARKPGRALGRPAAARGARARPDQRAEGAAPRRAALGARPVPAHPHARRAQGVAGEALDDLRPRHPLAGRSDGAGRPGGRDERRPDRAAGPPARRVQRAAHRVRRPLHRRPQRHSRGRRQPGRGARRQDAAQPRAASGRRQRRRRDRARGRVPGHARRRHARQRRGRRAERACCPRRPSPPRPGSPATAPRRTGPPTTSTRSPHRVCRRPHRSHTRRSP